MNLNEDDRKWIEGQLEKQSVTIGTKIEAYIEARLEQHYKAIEAYIEARLEQQRTAFNASIMDLETKLLTEFHKWASPTELRISSHATAIRAIDLELELTKERIAKLEPKQ